MRTTRVLLCLTGVSILVPAELGALPSWQMVDEPFECVHDLFFFFSAFIFLHFLDLILDDTFALAIAFFHHASSASTCIVFFTADFVLPWVA